MSETITFRTIPNFTGSYEWRIRSLIASEETYLATNAAPNGWTVTLTPSGSDFIPSVTAPDTVAAAGHFRLIIDPVEDAGLGFELGTRYDLPLFTHSTNENIVTFNWSNTAFSYNDVADRVIASWQWEYGDTTGETIGAVETVAHEYEEDYWNTTVAARSRAYDQYGLIVDALSGYPINEGWREDNVSVGEGEGRIDSFINRFGERYGAVNEEQGVRVAKFKRNSTERILLHFQDDAKNPSLYEDKNSGVITLAFTQRSTGAFMDLVSTDSARTFL